MTRAGVVELPTRRATTHLGARIAAELRGGDLVVLDGPLGAGKTFLTRAICRALGLPAEERVTSPTFTLVNEYETVPKIVHADLYRLGGADAVLELGLDEARADGCAVLVEWGRPYAAELGGDGLVVELLLEPRRARLEGSGLRSSALAAAVVSASALALRRARARRPSSGG